MPISGSTLAGVAARVGGRMTGDPEITVTDVTHDSRHSGPGVLFVAVRGERHDGHDFVGAAVDAGSPAVAVEHPVPIDAAQIVVADTRAAMGAMASEVHHDPSRGLAVVGVTGTNGKTTVTHYVESIASGAGRVTGLIGTIQTRLGERVIPSERTTPEASDFQRLLAQMRDMGADIVATEVSSHALAMGRVAATRFEVAAFTNLSQDHLDFHGTMESYQEAKERLFREYEVGTAVINVDDPAGAGIAEWYRGETLLVGRDAEVRAENVATSLDGTTFDLVTPGGTVEVHSGLVGEFNVENALVAAGCCLALGLDLAEVGEGLTAVPGVPGRFESVSGTAPVRVIVDYAHTPAGVRRAIDVARDAAEGRVIALVGAGGDRDREKRPMMGAAAATADLAILTSDNPRSEDPLQILDQVAAGVPPDAHVVLEVDRRRAIAMAIEQAGDGDIVLVLGKGHESGQEIAGEVFPFDDREVVRATLGLESKSANSAIDSGSMSS